MLSEWISSKVAGFVSSSPENSLGFNNREKAWNNVSVGFSRGDDPFFEKFKKDIGEFYLTPFEILKQNFPDADISPDHISVISWILPQSEETRSDHRKQHTYPAERWTRARLFGEKFNNKIREYLVEILDKSGFTAVAPVLSRCWEKKTSVKYGFASNWSERHAAFVSGMGTFGLSDGLITPVGKAVRCGSVVANISAEPTPRPYTHHNEYCLFYSDSKCRKCIDRCPAGAITEQGHDKIKCKSYIRKITGEYEQNQYGLKTNSCGLCQVSVPCESKIPVKKRFTPIRP